MESDLQARDRIGVQDFVLLEDFRSEDAFLENLRKRYNSGLIYVSITFKACYEFSRSLAVSYYLHKSVHLTSLFTFN